MARPGQHMLVLEREILDRWLAKHDIEGEHVYDLHLPTPDPTWPEGYTDKDREEWRWLTMKRVDLLIRAPARRWILEVTPRVSTRALGALSVYESILRKTEGKVPPISLGVICEVGDAAVEAVCREQGVRVWVV